jgi:hypothetical protein
MGIDPRERQCYYDENGLEIQVDDLLKVFHFRHYRRKEKIYMYHVAILQESGGTLWWAGKEYQRMENKGHYLMMATADKETGIIKGCQIINKIDWEGLDRLKKEAKLRMAQQLHSTQ